MSFPSCWTVSHRTDSTPDVSSVLLKISRDNFAERADLNPQDVEKEKTRMVSALAQNLYIMCTLSKGQLKAINPSGRQ